MAEVVWHDLGDNGINWFNELSELYQSVDPDTTITSLSYPTDQWFGKVSAALNQVAGFCAWLLYDFRTMRRFASYQMGFNRKGLIAEDKTTRKAAIGLLGEAFDALTR